MPWICAKGARNALAPQDPFAAGNLNRPCRRAGNLPRGRVEPARVVEQHAPRRGRGGIPLLDGPDIDSGAIEHGKPLLASMAGTVRTGSPPVGHIIAEKPVRLKHAAAALPPHGLGASASGS